MNQEMSEIYIIYCLLTLKLCLCECASSDRHMTKDMIPAILDNWSSVIINFIFFREGTPSLQIED